MLMVNPVIGFISAPTLIYATWNGSDKDSTIALSGGNLIATHSSANAGSVRADTSMASGKWYWECTVGSGVASWYCGIAKSTASLTAVPGGDADGWSYTQGGGGFSKFNNATFAAYGNTFTDGDIIGFALDLTAGAIWCSKNNSWQNSATQAEIEAGDTTHAMYASLSGTFYPAFGSGADAQVCTANFGASAFSGTVPSGFNSGVYV